MVLESQQQFVKTVNMRMIGGGNVKKGIISSGNNMLFRVSSNRQAGLGVNTLDPIQLMTLYGRSKQVNPPLPPLTVTKIGSGSSVTHEKVKTIINNSPHQFGNIDLLSAPQKEEKTQSTKNKLNQQKQALMSLLEQVEDDINIILVLSAYSDNDKEYFGTWFSPFDVLADEYGFLPYRLFALEELEDQIIAIIDEL